MDNIVFAFIALVLVITAIRLLMQGLLWLARGGRPRQVDYVGPGQIKLVKKIDEKAGLELYQIMYRGMMPVRRSTELSFAISAFDETDAKANPVLSLADAAQEKETICYQFRGQFGRVNPQSVITDWAKIGIIVPGLIQPPRSGERTIRVIVRFFDTHGNTQIVAGLALNSDKILYTCGASFRHSFTEKGYKEAAEHREEAHCIALKIGVAVAMADGHLDDTEGVVLKHWIQRAISPYSETRKLELKRAYNEALRSGFSSAQAGNLPLSPLVERLAQIGGKKSKYDAVELCMDVMAADGIADPSELEVIRNVTEGLGLDIAEVEKMREKVTLNLSTKLTSEEGLESLVGIDPSWDNSQKRKHLRTEFQKWSNRLNALPEGEERERAQSMLDNIAILRKKYA